MRKSWGIRDRMLLLAVMPPAVIAVTVGSYLVHTRIQDLEQAHRDLGRAVARQLAPAAEYGLQRNAPEIMSHLARAALSEPSVRTVTIRDASGGIIARASQEPPTEGHLARLVERYGPSDSVRRFRVPLAVSDGSDTGPASGGQVTVALSRIPTLTRQLQVVLNGLAITLVGLGASLWLGRRVSRDIANPVRTLAETLHSIRRGDRGQRVPETSGGELGTLERGINAMAASLEADKRDLEHQIDQATRDLRATLEELEVKNVELDLARRRAEEANRVKSGFLSSMSHEIRTPLNGILGFTQLLSRTRLDDEQSEYVQVIHKSTGNLLSTLNNILDYSRVEAGGPILDDAAFDLRQIAEDTMTLLAPLGYEKQLELVYLLYDDVPTQLRGDPARLRQALINLVSNAIKFTPRGSVVVRVMSEADDGDRATLTVSVTDTGVGIHPRDQARIFRAFTQVQNDNATRRYGGTGLGLFISERLIDAMGGRIGFRSRPERGSRFWFTVTLERSGEEPHPESSPLAGMRAISYEPFDLSALAFRRTLEDWGVEVQEADTPERLHDELVAARARDDPYDYVVVGLSPDDLDSPSTRELLAAGSESRYGLVALISSVDGETHQRARTAGAAVCLPKITNRSTLHERMYQLAAHGSAQRPPSEAQARSPELPRDSLAGLRLLCADDNRINLHLLTTLLRRYGASVDEVLDGASVLDLAAQYSYDVILLDLHMPDMSGTEVTRRLRESASAAAHTPIVAVTADAAAEPSRASLDAYLIKPITEDDLVGTIQRVQVRAAPIRDPRLLTGLTSSAAEAFEPGVEPRSGERSQTPSGANATQELAGSMLAMLMEDLPQQQRAMNRAFAADDPEETARQVHLIHGSAAFFDLPAIKAAAEALERLLSESGANSQELDYQLAVLNREIDRFLARYRQPGDASHIDHGG